MFFWYKFYYFYLLNASLITYIKISSFFAHSQKPSYQFADPHHFDVGQYLDPACHFDLDLDPDPVCHFDADPVLDLARYFYPDPTGFFHSQI